MSNKNFRKEQKMVKKDKVAAEAAQEPAELVAGTVTGCSRLNIREKPNKAGKVICVANAFSELLIDPSESTNEWLKVYTEAGDEGFCMKEFVTVTDKEQVRRDG